jgi:hypothetical protein
MTKYFEDHNYQIGRSDTPIVAGSSEWTRDYSKIPICSWCRRDLRKLQDHGRNISWYCSFCQIETLDEDTDNLRTKSKIEQPVRIDNSDNPSVSYAPEKTLQSKKKQYRGAFKNLQAKGVKITSYSELRSERDGE